MDPVTLRIGVEVAKRFGKLLKRDPHGWQKMSFDQLLRSTGEKSIYRYYLGLSYLSGCHGITSVDEGLKWLNISAGDQYGDPVVLLRDYYYNARNLIKSYKWHLIYVNSPVSTESGYFIDHDAFYSQPDYDYSAMTLSDKAASERLFKQFVNEHSDWHWKGNSTGIMPFILIMVACLLISIVCMANGR